MAAIITAAAAHPAAPAVALPVILFMSPPPTETRASGFRLQTPRVAFNDACSFRLQ
jgi:hypothetical protein